MLGGVALQVASLPFLQLLVDVHGKVETQDVVEQFERARGPSLVLFAVLVVTVAPVAEELLFRGALLRALQRRMSPAWAAFVSALAFAAVHPLSSPTIGSVIAVPALFALGLVSAAAAIRNRGSEGRRQLVELAQGRKLHSTAIRPCRTRRARCGHTPAAKDIPDRLDVDPARTSIADQLARSGRPHRLR